MSAQTQPHGKPVVASYCTTFLKPEMRHIYRQVTGLQRYETFVMTRERTGGGAVSVCGHRADSAGAEEFREALLAEVCAAEAAGVLPRGVAGAAEDAAAAAGGSDAHLFRAHRACICCRSSRNGSSRAWFRFTGWTSSRGRSRRATMRRCATLLQTVPLVLARSQSLMSRAGDAGLSARRSCG